MEKITERVVTPQPQKKNVIAYFSRDVAVRQNMKSYSQPTTSSTSRFFFGFCFHNYWLMQRPATNQITGVINFYKVISLNFFIQSCF